MEKITIKAILILEDRVIESVDQEIPVIKSSSELIRDGKAFIKIADLRSINEELKNRGLVWIEKKRINFNGCEMALCEIGTCIPCCGAHY